MFMRRQIRLALYSSNHLMKALNMRNKPYITNPRQMMTSRALARVHFREGR